MLWFDSRKIPVRVAFALLAPTAILLIAACTSRSDALPGFEDTDLGQSRSAPLPTLTADEVKLTRIGVVDFRACTGLVDQEEVSAAAGGANILLRDSLNRFNLGVPGDASRRGIVASCVLEYRQSPFDGEPGTTMTVTATAFESVDAADGQMRRLMASARTILLNLAPEATFEEAPLGENSFQLIANADRLGSIVGFQVGTTFTQLSTTVDVTGAAVISPEQLLALGERAMSHLIGK